MNVISPETRMMGLPYGEEIMIVGQIMWTQSTSVTDRQTDRRTDRHTELLSQRPCNAERRTVKNDSKNSGAPPPKKIRGQKHAKFRLILYNLRF